MPDVRREPVAGMNNCSRSVPKVSVVIPTYKRVSKLRRLLRSIFSSNYPDNNLEVIVVDDASGENYESILSDFPRVKMVVNNEPRWVAECRNIGMHMASGDFIFLIDDDNVVHPDCICQLVEFMTCKPETGVVAPLMCYLEFPETIWCLAVKRNYWTSVTHFIKRGTDANAPLPLWIDSEDFPNAFMVRKDVIKNVGYFDSRCFPIHYEEADFCRRVRNAGYKVRCFTKARVWHDVPLASREKLVQHLLRSPERAYFTGRNRVLFHRKFSTRLQLLVFASFFLPGITFYYLFQLLRSDNRDKLSISVAYLKGVWTGLTMSCDTGESESDRNS